MVHNFTSLASKLQSWSSTKLEHLARNAPYHMNATIKINIRIININAYDINQNDNIIYQFLKTILIIHITNHN